MDKIDWLLQIEDKIKKWIETNRFKWYFVLAFTGISLGVLEGYMLGMSGILVLPLSFSYMCVLCSCEFLLGGSGVD